MKAVIAEICPKCGRGLSNPARKLCPACLLRAALEDEPALDDLETEQPAPEKIGDYEILSQIARGGMGLVFRARQVSLNRLVALKLISGGIFASPENLRRFRIEAEIAAALDHPNIVPIFEVGEHDVHPYYSMALVEGGTLSTLLGAGPLPPRDAAEFMVKVAQALHYAHQRGVLHRDLKPTNILIDQAGEPHLTDFGLAKLLTVDSTLTHTNAILGTPSYMAPEQARGDTAALAVATDVYGLGAVLYHTLAGVPPFAGGTSLETVRLLLDQPAKSPALFNPRVDRDLATICLKALEKEPSARYQSAQEFAADLQRWLNHEPISARPASTLEKAGKLLRRHPVVASLLMALAMVLLAGSLAVLVQWRRAEQLRLVADQQRSIALQQSEVARARLYAADIPLAHVSIREGNLDRALTLLQAHLPPSPEQDLRGFEWRYLWHECQGSPLWKAAGAFGGVISLAFSRDGKTLYSIGNNENFCRVWNLDSKGVSILPGSFKQVICSADGQRLALLNRSDEIQLHDAASLRELWRNTSPASDRILFSPDSRLIAVGSMTPNENGETALLDVETGEVLHEFPDTRGGILAFAADSSVIATAHIHNAPFLPEHAALAELKVWKVSTGQLIFSAPLTNTPSAAAFAPDSTNLAVAHGEGYVTVFQQSAATTFRAHDSAVLQLLFLTNRIVTGSADHNLRYFTSAGDLRQNVIGHLASVSSLALSPDARSFASGSVDQILITSLDAAEPEDARRIPAFPGRGIRVTVWSGDSSMFTTVHEGGVSIWNPATSQMVAQNGALRSIPLGFDGPHELLSVQNIRSRLDEEMVLERWNIATGEKKIIPLPGASFGAYALSPSRAQVAAAFPDGSINLWNVRTGELATQTHSPGDPSAMAFSRNGSKLVIGYADGEIRSFEARTLAQRQTFRRHFSAVTSLDFAHRTNLMASASTDRVIHLWNFETGAIMATLNGHKETVQTVSFSPDDRTLASGGGDSIGSGKLWNLATFREVLTIPTGCAEMSFSPDGRWLVRTDRIAARAALLHAPSYSEIQRIENSWLRATSQGDAPSL